MGQDTLVYMAAHHQSAPAVSGGLILTQTVLRAQIQYLACLIHGISCGIVLGDLGIH